MWSRGIPGVLLCLLGAVWIAQGVGVLPGSFMSGQSLWAVLGAVAVAAGAALIVWAARFRPRVDERK